MKYWFPLTLSMLLKFQLVVLQENLESIYKCLGNKILLKTYTIHRESSLI